MDNEPVTPEIFVWSLRAGLGEAYNYRYADEKYCELYAAYRQAQKEVIELKATLKFSESERESLCQSLAGSNDLVAKLQKELGR